MTNLTITDLLNADIALIGSDWKNDSSVKGPFSGKRYIGEKSCIDCNDVFYWDCVDCEDITEETLPDFNQAVDECNGNIELGAILYCARKRKMRPQGAMYTYIPKHLWELFDNCGPEREISPRNPFKPGEYHKENQLH